MGKFLSCGLIAAFAILPVIKVCAEPPPAEPAVVSIEPDLPSIDCASLCQQPQANHQ